jgi:hypothetical protein
MTERDMDDDEVEELQKRRGAEQTTAREQFLNPLQCTSMIASNINKRKF